MHRRDKQGKEIVAALTVRKPESGDWLEIELESGGVSLQKAKRNRHTIQTSSLREFEACCGVFSGQGGTSPANERYTCPAVEISYRGDRDSSIPYVFDNYVVNNL